MFNIVLYEPEIPPNTGNIARLCVATGCHLFLKKPLGFSIDDKTLRRAGLDYWKFVNLDVIDSLEDIHIPDTSMYFFSTKAKKLYTDISFKSNDIFVFGPESRGLPEKYIINNPFALTIPMFHSGIRSLNLSTTVGIVVYEGIRQLSMVPSMQ